MPKRKSTTHLVVHTTASAIVEDTLGDIPEKYRGQAEEIAGGKWVATLDPSAKVVNGIHRERGFARIGYHWLIRKDGTIEAGREEGQKGAHCKASGMNSKAIGIAFSGHHNYEGWTPEQRTAWLELAVRICREYTISVRNVIGHREAGARKDCPGTAIDMDAIRAELARRLRDEPDDSLLAKGSHGPRVGLLQMRLQETGHYSGRIDDDFGPMTDGAVRTAQIDLDLVPDGVVGPMTATALSLPWPSLQ
ncbi:MAG: N-acetylmuramoyl-L-alanine amidase [Bacteroidota bacterium]